jgi:hypothetical protein
LLIKLKGDDRHFSYLDHENGVENKRMLESESAAILEGRVQVKAGTNEPSQYKPVLPDDMKGHLLRGMHRIESRPLETREECLVRHDTLKRANLIAKDAPVRWFNPDTRTYEEI